MEREVHGNDYIKTTSPNTDKPLKEERRRMQQAAIAEGKVKEIEEEDSRMMLSVVEKGEMMT